jgi:hypothetical protein
MYCIWPGCRFVILAWAFLFACNPTDCNISQKAGGQTLKRLVTKHLNGCSFTQIELLVQTDASHNFGVVALFRSAYIVASCQLGGAIY